MHQTKMASEADLSAELVFLRQEVQVLRESIDEFRDDLVHAIRNCGLLLNDLKLSNCSLPNWMDEDLDNATGQSLKGKQATLF
jgi:hypothetical protein